LLLATTSYSFAQPSLAAENMINTVDTKTTLGEIKTYTLVRDALKADQWYYMPKSLRLVEKRTVDGKKQPKLTVIRYQYQDRVTKELKEGGNLTVAFTFGAEPESEVQMKQFIVRQFPATPNIRLAPLPFSSSKITLMTSDGDFLGKYDATPATGSTMAGQEMVLSVPLTVLGTDVFAALLNSTTGIAIKGEVKYNGLLPPCGITVKGNWNNVYKYIENNKFFSANAGGAWSWFAGSGSIQRSKQSIKDEMKTRLGLEINEYTCEKNSQAMDTYLQNIIDKVRDEVFTRSALDSARTFELLQQQLKDTNMTQAVKNRIMQRLSFLSVSVESRESMKEVTKRKSGQIDFSYNKHQQVERETRIDGALSLSAYHFTEAELKNYIIDVKAGDWPIAIFGLPQAVNTDLGVRSMSIEIGYKLPNGVPLKEARQWTPEKGWVTLAGKENSLIQFTLLGMDKKINMANLEFDAKLSIVSNIPNSSFIVQRKIKAFNGESNFSAVEQLTKQFIIDATSLDFAKLTSAPTDLDYVQVLINQGQKVFSKNIKPYFKDGVAGAPNLVSLLMGNEGVPINFEVFYVKTNGEKIKSKQTFTLGDISLGNFDWKE
jgi:hypothetical protein